MKALLFHYFKPEEAEAIEEDALTDWVRMLHDVPKEQIERACESYLRDQPRIRPTPGDIYQRCRAMGAAARSGPGEQGGDRAGLSRDELYTLESKILPTAQKWLASIPALAGHAKKTLDYWGEPYTLPAWWNARDHEV